MSHREASATGPLISVVMPVYRESLEVLGRAIDSVLDQTVRELELVVVMDDPAGAAKLEYLAQRVEAEPRIRLLVNEVNLGPWGSYARGIREARGAFVAIQDADDVSLPERLERQYAFLVANPDVGVVGCGIAYVDEGTGRLMMERRYPLKGEEAVRRYSPLAHPATMRRRGLDERYGGYDLSPSIRHAADYELWCRWVAAGVQLANLPGVLYRYYQSSANFKALHTRAILRDTVRIKRRYVRALRFGVVDRFLLAAEAVATVFPARLIVSGFYVLNRWRSRGQLDGRGAPLRGRRNWITDTRSSDYASRLGGSYRGWRRHLGVQAPYRWNIRRLRPGFVLDVGCGIGRNLDHLDGHGVGVDHNPHAVNAARERGLAAFTPDEFESSEWCRPDVFDAILVAHVLEHIDEAEGERLLAQYLRHLRPRGRVIAIVPQEAGFASDPSHVRYVDADAVQRLLERLGLTVERAYSFPLPRLLGRVFPHNETVVVGRLIGHRLVA